MKKLFLLMIASLICLTTISAQVSQEEADQIVIDRMSNETSDFIIYAKDGVQTTFEVITASGETLELNYPCWVYYVNFADETNGKYLIVKENNGNLLEVNAKNDEVPDVECWRIVGEEEPEEPIEIPFTEYSLEGTFCLWTNLDHSSNPDFLIINSHEELEQYIICAEGNYPEIDFSTNTLLLIKGKLIYRAISHINKHLQQISENEYTLNVELVSYKHVIGGFIPIECWHEAIVISKLNGESNVTLSVTNMETSCKLFNLPYSNNDVLLINSTEELENYIECTDNDDFPEIDFSNHTLLMAASGVIFGIRNINAQLIKTDENVYNLDIDILLNYTTGGDKWIVKILMPKLPSDVIITLNVDDHH